MSFKLFSVKYLLQKGLSPEEVRKKYSKLIDENCVEEYLRDREMIDNDLLFIGKNFVELMEEIESEEASSEIRGSQGGLPITHHPSMQDETNFQWVFLGTFVVALSALFLLIGLNHQTHFTTISQTTAEEAEKTSKSPIMLATINDPIAVTAAGTLSVEWTYPNNFNIHNYEVILTPANSENPLRQSRTTRPAVQLCGLDSDQGYPFIVQARDKDGVLVAEALKKTAPSLQLAHLLWSFDHIAQDTNFWTGVALVNPQELQDATLTVQNRSNHECSLTLLEKLERHAMISDGISEFSKVDIAVLTSGQDFYNNESDLELRGNPHLVYAPGYELVIGEVFRPEMTLQPPFEYLPGTACEGEALIAFYGEHGLRVETGAVVVNTEAWVDDIVSPSILHIATHGFYSGPGVRGGRDDKPVRFGPRTRELERGHLRCAMIVAQQPLLASGLALARADRVVKDILVSGDTEGNLLSMDLGGTELVVLSACETGIGDPSRSDDVYSLNRIYFEAGAKTVLFPLWSADDKATAASIEHSYTLYLSGQTPRTLRFAQHHFIQDLQWNHPFYWVPFVLSGEK